MSIYINEDSYETNREVLIWLLNRLGAWWVCRHRPLCRRKQANLLQRDCCFSCPAKSVETKSDIVAGDYWGVDNFHRDIADDRGVSCLIVRNKSLLPLIKSLPLELTATKYEYIAASNPAIERSARPNPKREQYLQSLACKDFIEATKPLVQTPLSQKTRLAINNFKHSLLILLQRIKPYR